ncbi:MAG TPA: hypothetical protein V6C57_01125 [Coleofasciculaceae cyanobacterium]
MIEGLREIIEGIVRTIFAARRGDTPGDNTKKNKEFRDAVKKLQQILGRELSKEEERQFHDAVSGQGYGFWEMVYLGFELFADSETQNEWIPEDWDE